MLGLDLLSLVSCEVVQRHLVAVVASFALILVMAQNAQLRSGVVLPFSLAVADNGALNLVISIVVALWNRETILFRTFSLSIFFLEKLLSQALIGLVFTHNEAALIGFRLVRGSDPQRIICREIGFVCRATLS